MKYEVTQGEGDDTTIEFTLDEEELLKFEQMIASARTAPDGVMLQASFTHRNIYAMNQTDTIRIKKAQ